MKVLFFLVSAAFCGPFRPLITHKKFHCSISFLSIRESHLYFDQNANILVQTQFWLSHPSRVAQKKQISVLEALQKMPLFLHLTKPKFIKFSPFGPKNAKRQPISIRYRSPNRVNHVFGHISAKNYPTVCFLGLHMLFCQSGHFFLNDV